MADDERTMDERLGFMPGTIDGVHAVERTASRSGLAQKQQVLAVALWRSITSHPVYQMQADMLVERVVLERGGRNIRAEVLMFPHEMPPAEQLGWRARIGSLERRAEAEPVVRWRGRVSDLVTDLLDVLGPEMLERLCDEALPRARLEWAKRRAAAESEHDADE